MNQIALLIRSIRDTGMSQSDISRKLGISQPKISRWEGGSASAGAKDVLNLMYLAQELGIDVATKVKAPKRSTPSKKGARK